MKKRENAKMRRDEITTRNGHNGVNINLQKTKSNDDKGFYFRNR